MDKATAIRQLAADDHAIFSADLAKEIGAAFGMVPNVPVMRDSRNEFKGATLPGATRAGQRVAAIGGMELMYQICGALKLDTSEADRFFGRGRTSRELVRIIAEGTKNA